MQYIIRFCSTLPWRACYSVSKNNSTSFKIRRVSFVGRVIPKVIIHILVQRQLSSEGNNKAIDEMLAPKQLPKINSLFVDNSKWFRSFSISKRQKNDPKNMQEGSQLYLAWTFLSFKESTNTTISIFFVVLLKTV